MSLETEVKAVEGEAKAVVAEFEKVAEKVEEKTKAAVIEISTEEKLFLRETELEFLKAQMEIQRISKITEAKSKEYQTFIEGLYKKYLVEKSEYVFDAVSNSLKKL